MIATYAVDDVPWAWIEQTRPGRGLVFPGSARARHADHRRRRQVRDGLGAGAGNVHAQPRCRSGPRAENARRAGHEVCLYQAICNACQAGQLTCPSFT
ncbi:hypothetical protein ABT236_37420 [Streptomyces sp. NPDC001523]|uniref:hypothetical protein n=1 Tax=Streptomyces sp. NPDC001523 TaxID=3154383 RepID=UPI003326A8E8